MLYFLKKVLLINVGTCKSIKCRLWQKRRPHFNCWQLLGHMYHHYTITRPSSVEDCNSILSKIVIFPNYSFEALIIIIHRMISFLWCGLNQCRNTLNILFVDVNRPSSWGKCFYNKRKPRSQTELLTNSETVVDKEIRKKRKIQ